MLLLSTLGAIVGGWAASTGTYVLDRDPIQDTLALCQELAAEPRIPGTGGYDRAVELLEAFLEARGVPVERIEVSVTRGIPTRSDVLLFEDSSATSAFDGLRERWSPDSVPTQPLPAAYGFNVENGNVRGAVVDAGAGSQDDFARLKTLRVPTDGAIALVSVQPSPIFRERIFDVAARAAQAGFAGLLVAPPSTAPVPNAPMAPAPVDPRKLILEDRSFGREDRLAIPAAPIQLVQAQSIQERLRVKRVRGEDGQVASQRLGPGPVEAQVRVECPLVKLDGVPALIAGLRGREKATVHVPIDESWELPIQGAALAAVGASAAQTGDPLRLLLLAPRGAPRSGLAVGNALAPLDGLVSGWSAEFAPDLVVFGGRTRMPASYDTSVRSLDRRLGGELSKRADAATLWIAYLLRSEIRPLSQEAPGGRVLIAPIPAALPPASAPQSAAPHNGSR